MNVSGDSANKVFERLHVTTCLRIAAAVIIAISIVLLCWFLNSSVYSEVRTFAGPIGLFQTRGTEDKILGAIVVAILLPTILAPCARLNRFTVAASLIGCLFWIGFGLWLEVMASV